MKRLFYLTLVLLSSTFFSCSDEAVEPTNVPSIHSPSDPDPSGGGQDDDDPIPPGGVMNPSTAG